MDQKAWEGIHKRATLNLAEDSSNRPKNYREIEAGLKDGGDFEFLWSDFLHAFYDYKDASFFAEPSPASLSPGWQALLAGAAEWLSAEFGLPAPAWIEEPRYFLDRPWDPMEDMGIDMAEYMADKLDRSPEAFRRRNVAFLSRNLIAL